MNHPSDDVFPLLKGAFAVSALSITVNCGGPDQHADHGPGSVQARRSALGAPAVGCSAAKLNEILTPAEEDNTPVEVDCSFRLPSRWFTITRRLMLSGSAASGVTIDCNGGWIDHSVGSPNWRKDSIVIRSLRSGSYPNYQFDRPTDIKVNNCNILGSIRIMGMAHNGQGNDDTGPVIRYYSMRRDFTQQARAAAPTRIKLENLWVSASERTPLYLAPGVTYVSLTDSTITGSAVAAAVYFDAESAFNTLRGNTIDMERKHRNLFYVRELISIDGSSHNKLLNNTFSALNNGGIYLYRNCGEGGTARHATPSHNQIINNVFFYKNYSGKKPAVYFGAKEGLLADLLNPHCDEDSHGYYGSSVDNTDYARHNVVMQNQFYDRPLPYGYSSALAVAVKTSGSKNKPNYVSHNQVVSAAIDRKAGCYVSNGYLTNLIKHGEMIDVFRNWRGEPVCTGYQRRCNDGTVTTHYTSSCSLSKLNRECRVTGNNRGCRFTATCPTGKRVIAARAACNLEWGSVSSTQLAAVPIDQLQVVRPSDYVWSGYCGLHRAGTYAGTTQLSDMPSNDRSIGGVCREHDTNGGDCHIKAEIYCQGESSYQSSYYTPSFGSTLSSAY